MSASESTTSELHAENRRLRLLLSEAQQVAHDACAERDDAVAKLSVLERRIEQLRRRVYARTSERHHPDQQHLDLGMAIELPASDPAASDSITSDAAAPRSTTSTANVAGTETPDTAVAATAATTRSRAGRHPGRRRLPVDADVVIEDLLVPECERLDENGQPLPLLGYRTTDKWDYRAGTYLIRRYRRGIYGRPFSDAADRVVAPAPACLIPGGKMTDAALIHTVVEKLADHLPLYRQCQRAGRTGIHLGRSTLVAHLAAVADAVEPIVDAIATRVRASSYLHLDDTPVKLLDPGRGHTATARIWVYRSAEETVFRFTTTREGRHPAEFLGGYRGFIVADAYAGHERLYGPSRATPVGCWAHVRRKFHEIHEREPFAERMLDEIGRLYAIEDDVDLIGDHDERRRIRQVRAVPLLHGIRQRLDSARTTILPASALGGAISYALTRWPTLTTYTTHGMLPIDNNPAENALRPWAIGRKNWLFIGSQKAGERAAVLATLIENCRSNGLDPSAYLRDTVTALHRGVTDYDALTPRIYATTNQRRCG